MFFNKNYSLLNVLNIVLVVVGLMAGGFMFMNFGGFSLMSVPEGKTTTMTSVLNARLESISELNSADYKSEVVVQRKKFAFSDWDVPFNRKELVVAFTGYAKAGISNLKEAEVRQIGIKTYEITLPAPVITNIVLSQDQTKVYVNNDYVFNRNEIPDWNEIELEAKDDIRKRAEDAKIYDLAKTNARNTIKGLLEDTLENAGVKDAKIVVKFKA